MAGGVAETRCRACQVVFAFGPGASRLAPGRRLRLDPPRHRATSGRAPPACNSRIHPMTKPKIRNAGNRSRGGRPAQPGERTLGGRLKAPGPNQLVVERRKAMCGDITKATNPLDAAHYRGWAVVCRLRHGRAVCSASPVGGLWHPGEGSRRVPRGRQADRSLAGPVTRGKVVLLGPFARQDRQALGRGV